MRCLLFTAHPLPDSLCATLATRALKALTEAGHEVVVEDLCRNGFQASLTAEERRSYYGGPYESKAVQGEIGRLLEAEGVVLVFPAWWFGFPAILKGWFVFRTDGGAGVPGRFNP